MGNYHHHQNPSAFKLDLDVVSTVCNLYDAEGLYVIDSTQHSPLLGYAYDGFPIYGAYGYANTDGTGGIARMKSGYQLRNISQRTTAPNGTDVDDGPAVDNTYYLGYFREDYEFVDHLNDPTFLDMHNGRECVTPEYPDGIYAYFCTVDENWNSAYPYAVGPTFYGVYENRSVNSIDEPTTNYQAPAMSVGTMEQAPNASVFPNPSTGLLAVQMHGLVRSDVQLDLLDLSGRLVQSKRIRQGSTIAYFDVQTVYAGTYLLRRTSASGTSTQKVVIDHR